ncbi:copper chaperone PCu(A)C [Paracoccus tegillarcae]|uniref:Copper chaperone PCu(A)C n=1 Tax=Paracoccus tegillarcae TaxID=1529068 RepID=A0A2K9ESD8_9RHOB|nr:copper chaperone PCu(A)C [Paracoccus tegillarcae]AUH33736.1 hypothetical protein CUV01_10350 [Paracoccus tegillarcae]
MKTLFCAAAAVLLPMAAFAHDAVAVEDGYARASNPKAGAAFMVLDNHREVACKLEGVSSDVAEKVELHTHKETDGIMKMVQIEGGIDLPAGQQHALQRGGDHVMLMGLHEPLENGDIVALTLDFGDCGTLDVEVPVDNDRQPGESAAGQASMDHGDMEDVDMDHGDMDHEGMDHDDQGN